MKEQELRRKIEKNPDNAMNHYYLGKELLKKPIKGISSIKEIENLFKKAVELVPNLWAPRILLGELLYKLERYKEAENYFRKALEIVPGAVSARHHLAKCIAINSASKENIEAVSERDVLYLFEKDLREFIKKILESNYRDNWWRQGVPQKARSKCAARREEGLEEEKDADLLLFADFYDYKEIIEHNKKVFASNMDIKEWCSLLGSVEPIRNAIAHNRPLSSISKIKDYCLEFQRIMKKVRNKL